LDTSTVEAISDRNATESGNAYFTQLSQSQRDSVEAIAMDMSAAFVKADETNIALTETKIVHDRFPIMKPATEAVDKVRRSERRQLTKDGNRRLSGTRYRWLTSRENLTEWQKGRFEEAFKLELETGKSWAYTEMLRDLWHQVDTQSATAFINNCYNREKLDAKLKYSSYQTHSRRCEGALSVL